MSAHVVVFVRHVQFSPVLLLAFVPMVIHAVVGTVRLTRRVQFGRLGLLLLAHALLFAALLIAAFGGSDNTPIVKSALSPLC